MTLKAALLGSLCVQQGPTAPPTRSGGPIETIHGVPVADPYRWLEDGNDPATRDWIDQQNAYASQVLSAVRGTESIRARLTELSRVETLSPPALRNGRLFFHRRSAGQELFTYVMRRGPDGPDEVLLDPHTLSPDLSVNIGVLALSEDGRYVVYGLRHGGEDEQEVRILDVDQATDLDVSFPRARYFGFVLLPDNRTCYYAVHGDEGTRVYRRVIGRPGPGEEYVFGQGFGPEQAVGVSASHEYRWLLLSVGYGAGAKKTDLFVKNLECDGPVVPLVRGIDAAFHAAIIGDRAFIDTDLDAPNHRVMVAGLTQPGVEHWREIIPERPDASLEGIALAGDRLLASYLQDVQPDVRMYSTEGEDLGRLRLPAPGNISWATGRWQQDEVFAAATAFHVPPTIFCYRISSGAVDLWHRPDIPFDSDSFEMRQAWYTSHDGTRVPMFITHKRGLPTDGSAPALLTGYGGFQASLTPAFSPTAALWMELGGVHAVANLRGGGEFGETWHEAGMLDAKQNTFDDFIAAAEHLVAEGYTNPGRLAIRGGSNGGLLVGAALTQRPDLFRAVVCTYPLLDMVRYHKFLLGPLWISEYGSADDPGQFHALLAYSPYHNVRQGAAYPAVLFVTGDSDTRVAPLHARKMCALLQASSASGHPVILRYDTRLGHSGGRPQSLEIHDQAIELAFVAGELGIAMPERV